MQLKDIAHLRLYNQQIAATKFTTVKDIVSWMGAMQAQDYAMAKWATGLRLPQSMDDTIEAAISKGEIIRTHVLRPTWHFIAAKDIYWMLALTSPQIKTAMKSSDKRLELSDTIYTKSNKLIEKALSGGKHLSREELVRVLEKNKINTSNYRSGHFMLRAELDGIICSGATKNKTTNYALLAERVRQTKTLHKEEALATLAQKYFFSHGPATLQDFIWWSGLKASDAKHAMEMIKDKLLSETIGANTYWFNNSSTAAKRGKTFVYLLPAYDEFIISYKNRSILLPAEMRARTISSNGIFRPVIIIDGKVAGLWQRKIKGDNLIIETTFFSGKNFSLNKNSSHNIEITAKKFAQFLQKKISNVKTENL